MRKSAPASAKYWVGLVLTALDRRIALMSSVVTALVSAGVVVRPLAVAGVSASAPGEAGLVTSAPIVDAAAARAPPTRDARLRIRCVQISAVVVQVATRLTR